MLKHAFVFFLILNAACFASASYPCFNSYESSLISAYVNKYEKEAENWFLKDLPPFREKWQTSYFERMNSLTSMQRFSQRYPDIYHNIILFEQRLVLMKEFWCENYYHHYMSHGWSYNQEQKEELISQEKSRVKFNLNHCRDVLEDCSSKITSLYATAFEECLKNNKASVDVYHDYGLLAYLNNNFDKSLEMLSKMIALAEKTGEIEQLDSMTYCQLGEVCLEAMLYDKAIQYLSKSIKKDATNKAAYFHRAAAYFETGKFDEAIEDYLQSDKGREMPKPSLIASDEFTEALIKSVCNGALESTIEAVPSLWNSINGLRETIWAAHWATNPANPEAKENINNFSNACYEIAECCVKYCKDLDSAKIEGYVDEIKTLYKQFDQLSDKEKGDLIGHAVGKYGVDILIGVAEIKGLQFMYKTMPLFRNLKTANQICNFEAMSLSQANKEAVIASSLSHAAERDAFFRNVRIHWGKQNKHIPGKHNFEVGRGTILIDEAQLEKLVKGNAGKGQKVKGSFGDPEFKERVDFGTIIGDYALQVKGKPTQYIPTSKGIIIYTEDSMVHVVPSDPYAVIY